MSATRTAFLFFIGALVYFASASYKPAYYPYGPQVNVSFDQLIGWKRCWMNVYNNQSDGVEEVFNKCTGAHLLYGCRNGSSVEAFTVMAVGLRSIMMNDTGSDNEDQISIDNGVGFYFNNVTSIGFIRAEDSVGKNTCDMDSTNGEYRLCWHTSCKFIQIFTTHERSLTSSFADYPEEGDTVPTFKGGYRCGVTQDLNDDAQWIREIWMPADPCEGKNEGDTCDDFNPCTTATTCQSGVCTGGKPACGCLECDATLGCLTTPVANGTTCDDDNLCTQVDTCQSGVCVGASPKVCLSEQQCFNSTCVPTTGKCELTAIEGCTSTPTEAGSRPTSLSSNSWALTTSLVSILVVTLIATALM